MHAGQRSMCGVIVVDVESIGLLVSDVMPICMIIALDIIMTLRDSINCSTVIRSSTVILAIMRKPLVNTMAPGSTSHHIFRSKKLLCCTFHLQISPCNQSWRDWQPLYSVGCKFVCFFAGTLVPHLDTPTGLIPWFSNWGKYLLLLCCITLSYSTEKST